MEPQGNASRRVKGDASADAFLLAATLPLQGTLREKLRKIEALHAGTRIDGEREAARRAAERIRARLAELRSREREELRVGVLMPLIGMRHRPSGGRRLPSAHDLHSWACFMLFADPP